MAFNTNPSNAYQETRIKTAGQGRIVVMLYDESIKQLDIARSLLESNTRQLDKVHNAITRAQEVITELMVSLDFEQGGEIANNLFGLYMYFHNQLMEANVQKDIKRVAEVRSHMASLREAWEQIARKTAAPEPKSSNGINVAG